MNPHTEPPFDEPWREEIRRRSDELKTGAVQPIPWEDVKREARQQMRTLLVSRGKDSVIVEFPDENRGIGMDVTHLGGNQYRLTSVPLLLESVSYGDVIEADVIEAGRIRFRRMIERAGWKTRYYLLRGSGFHSEWGQELRERFEDLGGYWELILNGLLVVCIPPDMEISPDEWVETIGGHEL